MQSNIYASVERDIKLPDLIKLDKNKHLFKQLKNKEKKHNEQDDESISLPDQLIQKTNNLIMQLNDTFYVYQNPFYRCKFPESMFPPVPANQTNKIRYEQKMITQQQNTFKEKLTQEQLKQIENLGEFKVKSNIQYITLPYVWKINDRLFWGKKKVLYEWQKCLANIFGFFWIAKRIVLEQIPQQIKKLTTYPQALFKLLFGQKSIQTVVSVNYDRQILKDFWHKILRQYYRQSEQWCTALWNYLYVYYDPELSRPYPDSHDSRQKRQKLRQHFQKQNNISIDKRADIQKVHNKFNIEWGKLKKKVIVQITDQVNGANNSFDQKAESQQQLLLKQGEDNKDDKILQKLSQKKFTLYISHLQKQLPKQKVPLQVINSIVFLLRLFNVISLKEAKKTKQIQKRRTQISQKIKKQHTIKSLFPPFFDKLLSQQMAIIEKSINDEMYLNLLKDKNVTKFLKEDQIEAYKQFVKLKYNKDVLIEAKKKQLPEYHGPTRTFYSNYRLFPPYDIIHKDGSYSLKKISDDLTVDTCTNFWKLKLYWMRFKTWTINCLFFLSASALKGPVGLRCLWGVQDFQYQMNIQYSTGRIYYETRRTVIGVFRTVLEGIKESRARFEQTPDLGLLGKNFSRYFNYLQCYIFRFIFVGIIITLIGYPILILVASAITIVLVVTFWAWIPLIMVVTYIFNIVIYQFQSQEILYGFMPRAFPIFRIVFDIFKCLGIMLFAILNYILLAPIISLFLFLFCSLQQIFRRLLDALMLLIFTKLGRTPSRDTFIARKISGPGMSKQFYMSINQEDVYVLIQAHLQKIYLKQFNQLILKKIQTQRNIFWNVMSKVLSPFGASYNGSNILIQNINTVLSAYQNQYHVHFNRYPNNPYNVRFTQQEIDNYFQNTVSIVKRFVQKHQINGWIFQKYQLYEGMYDELTRSIWIQIFGCGQQIFQPLEKLDARFKLQDQYQNLSGFNASMKKQVGSVMRALQGDVALDHRAKKLTPFKHNLLNKELSTEQIHQIFNNWTANSKLSVHLDLQNVKTLFVPNLNIKQIIIVDQQERTRNIKNQTKIIDL